LECSGKESCRIDPVIRGANKGRCRAVFGRSGALEEREGSLEGLAIEDAAFSHLEAKSFVGVLGQDVIELGVRGHFGAPLARAQSSAARRRAAPMPLRR
jgi:hypothetical protein